MKGGKMKRKSKQQKPEDFYEYGERIGRECARQIDLNAKEDQRKMKEEADKLKRLFP